MTYLLILLVKILLIVSILAHAKENAVTSKEGVISHTFEFVAIAAMLGACVLVVWFDITITSLVAYIPLRMGLFGPAFGLITTGEYDRVGTKGYDRLIRWMYNIEKNKKYKFPAYTIWLAWWTFVGLIIDFAI